LMVWAGIQVIQEPLTAVKVSCLIFASMSSGVPSKRHMYVKNMHMKTGAQSVWSMATLAATKSGVAPDMTLSRKL